jgi:hypothetical protein
MCLLCPAIGLASGAVGGFLGFKVPQTTKGKILGAVLTSVATALTAIAIKAIFKVSLCGGGTGLSLARVAIALATTIPIALIYGVAFNYLVARFVEKHFIPKPKNPLPNPNTDCTSTLESHCNCSKSNGNPDIQEI